MSKIRKEFTCEQQKKREIIENNLNGIPPFCDSIRKMISIDGFIEYYEQLKYSYPTFLDAYERLEEYHISITGKRKYSDINAFKVVIRRHQQKK